MLYEPVICVVLRGRKETTFGERTFEVGAGDLPADQPDLLSERATNTISAPRRESSRAKACRCRPTRP